MGCITGLARPSVCLSVPYGLARKQRKGRKKPQLVSTFPGQE